LSLVEKRIHQFWVNSHDIGKIMKHRDQHIENQQDYIGLRVNEGIEQPPSVNEESVKKFLQKRRKLLSADEFTRGILKRDISLLSRAVTLVESAKPEHQAIAREIISQCLPYSGNSVRVGITGVPGAGKSTFIEALGTMLTGQGHKLAVLAIDPSSERTKGSILGDKTRMEQLAGDPGAFIRPSPSAGSLGGVARKTRETVILCEAAGFDTVFIETVGVGQSETAVHSMTDFFLLLMLAGAGDELQGIKRGIMEMADIVAINKADGNNREKAELAKIQYRNALRLFPVRDSQWEPLVMTCSSTEKSGIAEIWEKILDYKQKSMESGFFRQNRSLQSLNWMYETINDQLKQHFYHHPVLKASVTEMEGKVLKDEISSFEAARQLLNHYYQK
jgi:LAO/AO transport system kinase